MKNLILTSRGSKLGAKNDEQSLKNDAETERLGNSILIDLGAILGLQNGAKTVKNRC